MFCITTHLSLKDLKRFKKIFVMYLNVAFIFKMNGDRVFVSYYGFGSIEVIDINQTWPTGLRMLFSFALETRNSFCIIYLLFTF